MPVEPAGADAPSSDGLTACTVTLLAPYNDAAILLGSWDNWQEHPMEKGEDLVFRAAVALPEGTHLYRFRVVSRSWFFPGEWREIADPWARDIQPAAMVEGGEERDCAVIVVKDGAAFYPGDRHTWQHDDTPLPANDALIFYEMNVGDFSGGDGDGGGGRYKDVIAKLPYLVDLGITAIELMPVQEAVGDYWGYLPRYFYAPESRYGGADELKQLIDACHEHRIRVVLDVVTNHASSECPLAHIDHDYWFHHDNSDDFQFGPKFNYDLHDNGRNEYPARSFMLGALQQWTEAYHIDGLRFDATRFVANFAVLREFADAVWHKEGGLKPFIRVAEHLPLDVAIVERGGPMDAAWFADFAHQLLSTLSGQSIAGCVPGYWDGMLAVIDPRRAGFTSPQHLVRYIGSHDEDRLLHILAGAGITGEDALRRARLAATLLLSGYGFPLLYAGEEFGTDSERKIGENKLPWSRLETPEGGGLHDHYRRLIHLRRDHNALRDDTLDIFHADKHAWVVAYHRWDGGGDRVVTLANISPNDRGGYTVPAWPDDGHWRDILTDDVIEARDRALSCTLGPWQTRVFIKED